MRPPESPQNGKRRPASFLVEEESAARNETLPVPRRSPRSFEDGVVVTPDEQDPFATPPELAAEAIPVAEPQARKKFSFVNLAAAAFGTFLSLAFGLWADSVIRDLFTRADWLGYAALTALAIGLVAVAVIVGREIFGMMRLSAVQTLKAQAEEAALSPRPAAARTVVAALTKILSHRAETAKGRANLDATKDEIIDAPQLIELAERELLAPLDRKARALILGSSKRVSIVTAVSPRAIVDLAYVLFEVTRLIRAMAELYGGRPGTLGLMRLMRDVIAHLAVTGSIAVGDGVAQQLLGHGLASKLSKRLGEGVINGLLTARIGIAAMDLCRPLPFRAVKRPGIGDFISDIATVGGRKDEQ
ncbi:YcjF family protein [Neorhizobium sp. T25_13]|uniref:YcjF family protein n=1 Tax=Neorhizobium sp. T25_13 TaxID=2093830 RepID=UPI000CFA19A3|nr:TIGR01620 family protein [Neorhizobium sp. T25_13]